MSIRNLKLALVLLAAVYSLGVVIGASNSIQQLFGSQRQRVRTIVTTFGLHANWSLFAPKPTVGRRLLLETSTPDGKKNVLVFTPILPRDSQVAVRYLNAMNFIKRKNIDSSTLVSGFCAQLSLAPGTQVRVFVQSAGELPVVAAMEGKTAWDAEYVETKFRFKYVCP